MNSIPPSAKIKPSPLSIGDDVGTLFTYGDLILRAIRPNFEPATKELLQSGLIDTLVKEGLFPETTISRITIPSYAMTLEHKRISPVIFPFEWSPEMLRKAAFCVLQVQCIANDFGYELKDAHPYNVLFSGTRPVYIDLGSFIQKTETGEWSASSEFISSYILPLQIYKKGLSNLYKHLFLLRGTCDSAELSVASNVLASLFGINATRVFHLMKHIFRRRRSLLPKHLSRLSLHPIIRDLATAIINLPSPWPRKPDWISLKRQLTSIKLDRGSTWGDYHDRSGYYNRDGKIHLTSRMQFVVNTIKNLEVRTVLELAGNQGILSREISKLPNIEKVICTDYDEVAIDQLVKSAGHNERLYMACFDFMADVSHGFLGTRTERLRSELVIAMAVTHHLTLSQGYSISSVFSTLSQYTERFIIIEFMPLGLWDGKKAPARPHWYNEEWFVSAMSQFFTILDRTHIEENRIVYLGELIRKKESG